MADGLQMDDSLKQFASFVADAIDDAKRTSDRARAASERLERKSDCLQDIGEISSGHDAAIVP